MKQHLCAGFVMSRTTQYMFLKRPKQVYSRGKLEDRMQISHPTAAVAPAAGSGENNQKSTFFSLFIKTFNFVDGGICNPKAALP